MDRLVQPSQNTSFFTHTERKKTHQCQNEDHTGVCLMCFTSSLDHMCNSDLLRGSKHQIDKTLIPQPASKKPCRPQNNVLGSTVAAACDVVAVDWTCHIHQPRRDHQGGTPATFIRHAWHPRTPLQRDDMVADFDKNRHSADPVRHKFGFHGAPATHITAEYVHRPKKKLHPNTSTTNLRMQCK
jgi:hypothetical protein